MTGEYGTTVLSNKVLIYMGLGRRWPTVDVKFTVHFQQHTRPRPGYSRSCGVVALWLISSHTNSASPGKRVDGERESTFPIAIITFRPIIIKPSLVLELLSFRRLIPNQS
jgi:hypothetical protein